jgi:hypothetical protein
MARKKTFADINGVVIRKVGIGPKHAAIQTKCLLSVGLDERGQCKIAAVEVDGIFMDAVLADDDTVKH